MLAVITFSGTHKNSLLIDILSMKLEVRSAQREEWEKEVFEERGVQTRRDYQAALSYHLGAGHETLS